MAVIEQIAPIEKLTDLKKGILIPGEIFELWMQTWDWTFHQLARNEFPGPFKTLDEFQLDCICADPVLWSQSFLREPEDPDHEDPYNFFEYQKESIRYPGHVIHKDGSEVGKTREIIALCMYKAFTTPNGSGLNGAPQQTHLDEIIEGMVEQMDFNPMLGKALVKHRKHPHHAFYFTNRFKLYFRPSGYDGEAYRGVHVRTIAIKDEAAKDKNKKQWSEFWRAMKPSCTGRIYSVPDGDRSCDFYKLGQRAVKVESPEDIAKRLLVSLFKIQKVRIQGERFVPLPAVEDIYGNAKDPKEEVQIDSLKNAGSHIQNIKFKLFQWSKTLMPAPYWSAERKRFFIDQYNGEDSAEYKHNVQGEDGDPEYSVFPWEQFKLCIKDIPEYRALKVLVNSSSNEVSVTGCKCEFVPGDSGPVPEGMFP